MGQGQRIGGKMSKTATMIEGLGFVLLMVGMSAMDSPSMAIPLVMTFGGIGLMYAGASMEGFR